MKPSSETCDPVMLEALRSRAGPGALMGFADFMDVALYDPAAGYYRRTGPRVGYGPATDFVTASTSSPLFGRLVSAACVGLLGGADPSGFEFVEIGAEPGTGILEGIEHPFGSVRHLRLGDPLAIEGRSVVFSNELFDAQPFRRFRFRKGAWREIGVAVIADGVSEAEIPLVGGPRLPGSAAGGYVIDAPTGSAALLRRIAEQPWSGLFLAFDYGKSWEEIIHGCPEGTARTYRRHVQGSDLLASPGDQDLTCHVCWDWLAEGLRASGFGETTLESQEAFFIRRCGDTLAALTASHAGHLSREKLSLLQLLHPAHMGQKFQALWALREPRTG